MPVQAYSMLWVTDHPSQHEMKCWIYYIDSLGEFDYGPATRTYKLAKTFGY